MFPDIAIIALHGIYYCTAQATANTFLFFIGFGILIDF